MVLGLRYLDSFGLIASAANLLLLRRIKELCHSLGGVLSVSIHHDNGIAANGLFNMHKSNGNGSLVTHIAAQTEYPNCPHSRERRGKDGTFARLY